MTELNILVNNPFRILGVASNADEEEIAESKDLMLGALETWETATSEIDMEAFLPEVNRTEESLQRAEAELESPVDKVKYAFFWFCQSSEEDAQALRALSQGDAAEAESVWSAGSDYSSVINLACLGLIQKDPAVYLTNLIRLLEDSQLRSEFIIGSCGINYDFPNKEICDLVLWELSSAYSLSELRDAVDAADSEDLTEMFGYLPEKVCLGVLQNELTACRQKKLRDGTAAYREANRFLAATAEAVEYLQNLEEPSTNYVVPALDAVANYVMDCAGKCYFEPQVPGALDRTKKLLEAASKIAAGEAKRQACAEQLRTVAFAYCAQAVSDACFDLDSSERELHDIESFWSFVSAKLDEIRTLGAAEEEADYRSLSVGVVRCGTDAVMNCLDRFNRSPRIVLAELMHSLKRSLAILDQMRSLYMDARCRQWFEENYETVRNSLEQMKEDYPELDPEEAD